MFAEIEHQAKKIDFLEADVKNDFYTAKKQIEFAGYKIPSLEELALAVLRVSNPRENPLINSSRILYVWTRDFSVYVPGKNGIYLKRGSNSPIIENDKEEFNQKGHMWPYQENKYDEKSIYLNEEDLPKILEGSIFIENPNPESDLIRLEISTNEFGRDLVTNYLFGKETAQKYGELLKQLTDDEKKFVQLELGNKQKLHSNQLCWGNVFPTNYIITNKCCLHSKSINFYDARVIGLKIES